MRKRVDTACGFLAALLVTTSLSSQLQAEDLPDYMKGLVGVVESTLFGNYHLMDYKLMGGDVRDAIIAEDEKRG